MFLLHFFKCIFFNVQNLFDFFNSKEYLKNFSSFETTKLLMLTLHRESKREREGVFLVCVSSNRNRFDVYGYKIIIG